VETAMQELHRLGELGFALPEAKLGKEAYRRITDVADIICIMRQRVVDPASIESLINVEQTMAENVIHFLKSSHDF
jgi:hypothetical protein